MSLFSTTSFLGYMARLRPEMQDAINPHGPVISVGSRHVMASMVIKTVAEQIKDPAVAKELQRTGKSLFEAGTGSMSYEDDNWCGTLVPHHFHPHPEPSYSIFGEEAMLNPQPLPPHEKAYFGAILSLLADAVSVKNTAQTLRSIGATLMDTSSETKSSYSAVPSYSEMENGK